MDTGDRLLTSKGRSHRLVAGARRHLRGWDLEGAVTASRSRVRELTFNTLLSAPLQEALLGMGAREGNRWYDPFGLNPQNNPEVMDEFRVGETWNRSTTRELTFDVLAQGSLGNIRSRPIGVAAGLQWREQSLDEELDAVQRAGGLAGLALAATPLRAERTISSGFLEVMLPLEHSLELQMALRADRYSDFGSTFNPKLGVAWRAAKPLLLRATWGTSFRPPAFRELADPLVEETAMYQNDPWRCPATGAFFDCFGDLVPLTRRGNPDLDPELGTTVVLGLLWERAVASAARVSLDVWRIEHEDRITLASLSDQTLLEQVPPDRNPFVVRATPTPADVAPGVPGRITALTDTYFNADRLDTRGVDAEGTLTWGDGATGEVTARLTYTYLDRFALGLDFAGVNAAENLAGGLGVFGPLPRHRGTFALSWQRGRNGATGRLHYAGSYRSTTNVFENGLETNMPFRVDAWWSLDLQYSYRMARLNDAILRVGCQNCTDEDPPTYNDTISGANIHDGRGAIVYVGWSQPF